MEYKKKHIIEPFNHYPTTHNSILPLNLKVNQRTLNEVHTNLNYNSNIFLSN